jgi:FMN phosphatase YigB (HAD superfamily)
VTGRLILRHLTRPWLGYETFRIIAAYRQAQERLRKSPTDSVARAAQIRVACEMTGLPARTVESCIVRWFEEAPLPLLSRFIRPGLAEFLVAARQAGVRLGVFSDYPAEAKLQAMGLGEYFDVVLSAQDPRVGCFKPNPLGLEVLLRELAAPREAAIYVGDRPEVDAEVARRAGVAAVIIGGPRSQSAEWSTIRSFPELGRRLGLSPAGVERT